MGRVQRKHREPGPSHLYGYVGKGEHQPALSEGPWYRHRHHQAREHHGNQHQANWQYIRVEPVGEPGGVLPRPPDHEQQEERLQRSLDRLVGQEQVGELGYGEDVDEIEKQL
jgi:hypothetical protein